MIFTILLLLAPPQEEVKDGKTYINKKYSLTFSLPSADWGTLRCGKDLEWKWAGGVCEFVSQDQNVIGGLVVEEPAVPLEKYAEAFEQSMTKTKTTKSFKETKRDKVGEDLRLEYLWEFGEYSLHYVALMGTREKESWRLCVGVEEKLWDKRKGEIGKIVDSFKTSLERTVGDAKETALPNPWKGCGKGSWTKFSVESSGSKYDLIYVLVDQDAESYTFRTDTVYNGQRTETAPVKVDLKQKYPAATGGDYKSEQGEESLKTSKGEFKCKWTRTSWKEGWTKTWMCDDVPFQMVRSETEYSGVKTVMDLMDFEKK